MSARRGFGAWLSGLRVFRSARAVGLPRQGSLRWSFQWAFEGIVYALRTQRNMQVHVTLGVASIVAGIIVNITRFEMLAVIAAITLVMMAEMFNTAVEAAIDAVVSDYHPLVKVAKDVAAGAVLVAAVNATAVAYLVFYDHLVNPRREIIDGIRDTPVLLVVGALIVTVLAAVALKALTQSGTALRGGWPSGHAAAAFSAWSAITIITDPLRHAVLISILAFMMALLVAQSRVEGGIHSWFEVLGGAMVGTLVTVLLFRVLG